MCSNVFTYRVCPSSVERNQSLHSLILQQLICYNRHHNPGKRFRTVVNCIIPFSASIGLSETQLNFFSVSFNYLVIHHIFHVHDSR